MRRNLSFVIIAAILIMSLLPMSVSAGTHYQPIDRIEEFEGSEEIYDAFLHTIYDPEKARYDEAGFRYYTFEQFRNLYPLDERYDVYKFLGNYGKNDASLVLICSYHGCLDNVVRIGDYMIEGDNYTIAEQNMGLYLYADHKAYRLEDAYETGIFTDADMLAFRDSAYVKNTNNLKVWTLEEWAVKEKVEAGSDDYHRSLSSDVYQAYLRYLHRSADTDLSFDAYWKNRSQPSVSQLYFGDYNDKTVVMLAYTQSGVHTMRVGEYEVAVDGYAIDTVESDLFCFANGEVTPLNVACEQGLFTGEEMDALADSDYVLISEHLSLQPKAPDQYITVTEDTQVWISTEVDEPAEEVSAPAETVSGNGSVTPVVKQETPASSTLPVRKLVKVPVPLGNYAPYLILGGAGVVLVGGALTVLLVMNRRKKKSKTQA